MHIIFLKENNFIKKGTQVTKVNNINNKTTPEQKEQICNMYKMGYKVKDMSETFGICVRVIHNLLKRKGIPIQPRKEYLRKYTLDENYFDNIDTEEKAYFVGLLYADGTNNINVHQVRLGLIVKDKYLLELLSNIIKSNKPLSVSKRSIKNPKHYDFYTLNIDSKYVSDRLNELGVVPAKTFKVTFPDWLDEKLYNHFIRGYFDGDGHIGISKKFGRASIIGTDKFCKSVSNILREKCNVNGRMRPNDKNANNNIVQMEVYGNNQVLRFMDYLYKNSTIYMLRKHDLYIQLKQIDYDKKHKKPRICSICEKPHFCKGYCKNHYYEYCNGKEKRRERYKKTKK